MAKTLVLIRHSKTIFQPEVSNLVWRLSEEGITKAEALSQNETIKGLDVLYSSDQTKALHTALLLAKENFIPIRVVPELTEATSITKKFFDNYEVRVAEWYKTEGSRINEGETTAEALLRFNAAIEKIMENENSETVGVVAHANVLSLYSSQFDGRTALELHDTIPMPDYAILDWGTKSFIKKFGND